MNKLLINLGLLLVMGVVPQLGWGAVKINWLHLNDVYEITGVSQGKLGGLARVATLRQRLLSQNPNTVMVLAGDFLSPSAAVLAQESEAMGDSEPWYGKPMIAILNKIGLDLAIFGNHEFDIPAPALAKRIHEAKFGWIAGNVVEAENGQAYGQLPETWVKTFKGPANQSCKVGVVAATIQLSKPGPWKMLNYSEAVARQIASLKAQKVDIIVALTHLPLAEDLILLNQFQDIQLLMGGHEHENILLKRGEHFQTLAKADANAKSVYWHQMECDPKQKKFTVKSELVVLDQKIKPNSVILAATQQWQKRMELAYQKAGFNLTATIGQTAVDLDGSEAAVRSRSNDLTRMVAQAMLATAPQADAALFFGGSMRIDDKINRGPITQYEVLRIFPAPEKIAEIKLSGELLEKLIKENIQAKGTGAYLQFELRAGMTQINNRRDYQVVVTEGILNYLKKKNLADTQTAKIGIDTRRALINYLSQQSAGQH